MHDPDIIWLKIGIPDKNILFATLGVIPMIVQRWLDLSQTEQTESGRANSNSAEFAFVTIATTPR